MMEMTKGVSNHRDIIAIEQEFHKLIVEERLFLLRNHPLGAHAKITKKLYLTPDTQKYMCLSGGKVS